MSDNLMSYTSRDYLSIFDDLIDAIPNLTDKWTSREETDPGIVLIKLMSMLGDMLSYNQDMKALEVYPNTVKERRNASQIFNGILGYKMKWYRSAISDCELMNSSSNSVLVPRFSVMRTSDDKIAYTLLKDVTIPPTGLFYAEAVQGIPVTPNKNSDISNGSNLNWHDIYDYNVSSSDIMSNKYYLNDFNVDQDHIILISDSIENYSDSCIEWELVDDVDLELSTNYCFEFNVDEENKPYIKLNKSWSLYASKFKLFYILSDGSNGEVSESSINKFSSNVYSQTYDTSGNIKYTRANNFIEIHNNPSTHGYNPESIDDARISSKIYRNTSNTLITLEDFKNAILRIDQVNNCYVTDFTCDPDPNFSPFTVKAYIVRDDIYQDYVSSVTDSSFKDVVLTNLNDYKLAPYDIEISTHEVNYYYWTIKGELYLTKPCSTDEIKELLLAINNKLLYTYSTKYVEFNSVLRYIDVIDTIKSVSTLIHYVDLNNIEYRDKNNNVVEKSEITGKKSLTIPYNTNESSTPLLYSVDLDEYPIKPGSLKISINSGQYILTDDGNGNIVSYDNITRPVNSKIIYGSSSKKANIKFELYNRTFENIDIEYCINSINIIKYINLNTKDFNVNKDSIKLI